MPGLPSEEVEKECQNNTDDNACNNGKVKSEVLFFDQDVAGQFSKPWDLWGQDQQNPDASYDKPHDDENFSKAR